MDDNIIQPFNIVDAPPHPLKGKPSPLKGTKRLGFNPLKGRKLSEKSIEKIRAAAIKQNESPEKRAQQSELMKSILARPGFRKAQSQRLKDFFSNPENRRIQSERSTKSSQARAGEISSKMKELWADPAYRAMQTEARRGIHLTVKQIMAIQYSKYAPDFKEVKVKILERDHGRCRMCHKGKNNGVGIAVHHIDWDKGNSDVSNLITLCQSCHKKIHNCKNNEMQLWLHYKAGGISAMVDYDERSKVLA